ncbi:MAG: serine acetyltransferase [Chitinophagaceae bacterium]|nr:MAG: serine acetyltransferase [Chitinophagaceae bacterium]
MGNEAFIQKLYEQHNMCSQHMPDKKLAAQFVEDLFSFLFIAGQGTQLTMHDLATELGALRGRLEALLFTVTDDAGRTNEVTNCFFVELPAVHSMLLQDADAVLRFDPAAESLEEVLVAYPGFFATAVYRLSHLLHQQGIKILPRVFSEYAHSKTGIDIHPGASIGSPFFIDHGTGIVIGETSVIGNDVKIYQGVTLGALSVHKEMAKSKRHPTIEDNVVIYSGATILGGDTVVGNNSVIGGNAWLTNSVLPNSVVYHKSEVTIRDKSPLPDVLNFVI